MIEAQYFNKKTQIVKMKIIKTVTHKYQITLDDAYKKCLKKIRTTITDERQIEKQNGAEQAE